MHVPLRLGDGSREAESVVQSTPGAITITRGKISPAKAVWLEDAAVLVVDDDVPAAQLGAVLERIVDAGLDIERVPQALS